MMPDASTCRWRSGLKWQSRPLAGCRPFRVAASGRHYPAATPPALEQKTPASPASPATPAATPTTRGQPVLRLHPHRQRQLQQQYRRNATALAAIRATAAHHPYQHGAAAHRQHAPMHRAQLPASQFTRFGSHQDQAVSQGASAITSSTTALSIASPSTRRCGDGRQPCRTPRAIACAQGWWR